MTPSPFIRAELLRITDQRAAIAAKKAALEKQDSQLASLWNTYQPLSRLPAELMVDVVTEYARDGNAVNLAWRNLRLVCRRWDEIACGTPSLWRTIHVRTNVHWLALCLTRSVEATLDITIHLGISHSFRRTPREPLSEDLQTTIFLHAARIRSLTVRSFGHDSWGKFSNLLPLFDFDMPALETIDLEALLPDASELHLSHRRHPRVHRLSLHRVCCPVELQLLSHLRFLKISSCRQAFQVDEFLDALASSTRLEELLLFNFLRGLIGEFRPPSPSTSRRPITLAHLIHLRIAENDVRLVSMFVSHLCLPANPKVELQGYTAFEGGFLGDTLSDLLPPTAHRAAFAPLLSSSTLTDVSLSILFSCFQIEAHDVVHGSSISLHMEYTGGELQDGPMRLNQGVSDLVDILGAAPLRRLSVTGIEERPPVDVWDHLFRSFPTLESLSLSAEEPQCDMLSFWTALGGSIGDDNGADPDSVAGIRCPNLSRLELKGGLPMSQELFLEMLECLARRGERGSWLEYLQLSDVVTYSGGNVMGTADSEEEAENFANAPSFRRPRHDRYDKFSSGLTGDTAFIHQDSGMPPKTLSAFFLGLELATDQLRASIVDENLELVGVEVVDFDTEIQEYQ
ncbi:hypothetical protein TRAPUB_14373 [Trametes pubescens]|uniref:F-box domain-containing protein n=1 Tax=Trametes pubescens TaxID=154538 RepID=A0A1M2VNL5_TRAPU|nr:hypothetical protein TRAPUB_14373 [Trametes pubescens]